MDSESVSAKHISPERGKYISLGQRPGDKIEVNFKALKGRNIIIVMHIYFALSGLSISHQFYYTGRCPVLKYHALSGH